MVGRDSDPPEESMKTARLTLFIMWCVSDPYGCQYENDWAEVVLGRSCGRGCRSGRADPRPDVDEHDRLMPARDAAGTEMGTMSSSATTIDDVGIYLPLMYGVDTRVKVPRCRLVGTASSSCAAVRVCSLANTSTFAARPEWPFSSRAARPRHSTQTCASGPSRLSPPSGAR